MEKSPRLKTASKLSYLTKASTFSIPQPTSPGTRSEKGLSGRINVSIIPKEARHKKKSDSFGGEPMSPKISCMGQVKHKKKKAAAAKQQKEKNPKKPRRSLFGCCAFGFRCMLRPAIERQEVEDKKDKRRPQLAAVAPAPGLGQMRRYKSSRETLVGFVWKDEAAENSDVKAEEEVGEVLVAHSAPILMSGSALAVEPKKEVNLWKRRAMPPPIPLQVVKK